MWRAFYRRVFFSHLLEKDTWCILLTRNATAKLGSWFSFFFPLQWALWYFWRASQDMSSVELYHKRTFSTFASLGSTGEGTLSFLSKLDDTKSIWEQNSALKCTFLTKRAFSTSVAFPPQPQMESREYLDHSRYVRIIKTSSFNSFWHISPNEGFYFRIKWKEKLHLSGNLSVSSQEKIFAFSCINYNSAFHWLNWDLFLFISVCVCVVGGRGGST